MTVKMTSVEYYYLSFACILVVQYAVCDDWMMDETRGERRSIIRAGRPPVTGPTITVKFRGTPRN